MKPGISAPYPYQTSAAGIHSMGTRPADPSSRGGEFEGRSYHESDGRKSGGDVDNRQFDHTTIDREVVNCPLSRFVLARPPTFFCLKTTNCSDRKLAYLSFGTAT